MDKKGKTMAYTQYFGSKPVSDWTANGPAESGHNFLDQINEQKGKVSEQEGRYQNEYNKIADARNNYENAYKNQQNYSDIYQQAKGTEGVDDARAQYQKSLATVNATQTAMNNLPSSVNAGSNVVLNANQRNAALGNQMSRYQNTLDAWTRQNADDLSGYQTALASAQDVAGKIMGQEQTKVAQNFQNLQTQMDMANRLYDQLINERQIMRSIYGDMYEDEYRHMQQELEAWAQNLGAETERYKEGQANYRAQLSANAQRYAADAGLRLQDYLSKQQANKTPSFLDYVNSDAYLNSMGNDMSYGEKKMWAQRLADNFTDANRNRNYRDLQNIYNGSSYQGYLDWLKG